MLLLVEIWLTVVTWKRGWKAWALLPIAVAVCIGMLIGASFDSASQLADAAPMFLLGDLGVIASLAVMSLAGHAHAAETPTALHNTHATNTL